MSINCHMYPYNIEARKLPIHLTGIGGSEWQNPISRPQGYKWHQILYSASGTGYLKFDNSAVTVGEGTFFFLPAEYPHEYLPKDDRWDVRWVAFDGYSANHILSLLGMTKPVVVKPESPLELERIFDRMFKSQREDKLYCDFTCSGLIYDYLIEFHRCMDDKGSKSRNERSRVITNVLEYIDENYQKDFPLTDLAEVAGVTPQHLCRIFKAAMNMRPNEYLVKKRVREAKRMMLRTEKQISEIASECGFPNAGYFSTVFKKLEGMTPAEYRSSVGNK